MILRISAVALLLAFNFSDAVVVKPQSQYGPPPQRLPHREYGVPQQIPFREYGPPALKYGPPKFISGGGGGFSSSSSSSSSSSNSFNSGFHEQIKTHFGVPKPFYGPPHSQHKPAPNYGPPRQQYGPPPRPAPQYGPPPAKPAPQYGPPPRPSYGPPPPPPQSLPSPLPAPLFKPEHSPASSYGPPPSGPLNLPPKPVYGPPKPLYGPPLPLPLGLVGPGPGPANFNKVPETTIILASGGGGGGSSGGHHHHHGGNGGGPVKQVQIQIDASGHTHSVSGSQAPFHTACDGWKPIPAPIGSFVEGNNIETQSGYSHVAQSSFGTQYNGGASISGSAGGGHGSGPSGSGGSIIDGLTDEQLVAVALQSGGFDSHSHGPQLPPSGPVGDFNQQNLNSIETDVLQVSLGGSGDDTYSKPPSDSYAPGSVHAQRHNNIGIGGGNYGPPPPQPPPIDSYGPPPSGNYLPPPSGNYGPPRPSAPPSDNYGPPPPPPPSGSLFVQEQHSSSSASSSASSQAGLHYGSQSGNVLNVPTHGASQPSRPVAFRPPVPQGLLESIGATVQHLDQFGVKPPTQPPTYIPPAANEIANHGPINLPSEYGPPPPPPPPAQINVPIGVIEQQLPQQQPPQDFVQVNQQHAHHHEQNTQHFQQHQQQQQQLQHQHQQHIQQQQQFNKQNSFQQFPPLSSPPPQPQFQFLPPLQEPHGNALNQYGPSLPPPAPQQQYLPPPPPPPPQHNRPFLPPPPSQEYLPPTQQTGPVTFEQQSSASSSASFENSYSSSQLNEQFIHAQALPLQQEPRFTQVHDCGQGPNLVSAGYQLQHQNQYQQQQQQQFQQQHSQQYAASNSVSSNSANAYNAISQSIPVAEQHTQFVEHEPADSYGLPTAGNHLDHDYDGYASQKSSVATLPDGTDPQELPGLDGLNVISAQKSQSIQLTPAQVSGAAHTQHEPTFQLDIAGNGVKSLQTEQSAHHEEILSEGLLQSILTAIEQPQSKGVQHQHTVQVVSNQHNNDIYGHGGAQSRSDTDIHEDATPDDENEPEVAESEKVEVQVNADGEEVATVQEIKPIVAAEIEDEAKH